MVTVSGKRKTAIARATIEKGKGKVRVNNQPLDIYTPELYRLKMMEPLLIATDLAKKVDLQVTVNGGGMSSQADAVRVAIANALVEFSKDEKLEEEFLDYDRNMLVADIRRKESRKPNRHGQARAKTQKSYR